MNPGTHMRSLPLGAVVLRRLPLGRGYVSLGQDDGSGDTIDLSVPDYGAPVTTNYSIPDLPAPAEPAEDLSIPGFTGPTTPGEVEIGSVDPAELNSQILSGAIAPPTGSALTSAQAANLNAAGATPDQVGQILNGQASYSSVLASLAQ